MLYYFEKLFDFDRFTESTAIAKCNCNTSIRNRLLHSLDMSHSQPYIRMYTHWLKHNKSSVFRENILWLIINGYRTSDNEKWSFFFDIYKRTIADIGQKSFRFVWRLTREKRRPSSLCAYTSIYSHYTPLVYICVIKGFTYYIDFPSLFLHIRVYILVTPL